MSSTSLPAITRSTATSVAASLSTLSASVNASVSTFFSRPVPLWLALLTSLTSVLALHLTSRFSRRAPLPASTFSFPASLRLSRLHFRHGWLQFDQQRTGTVAAEEAAALIQQLVTQVANNQRLQHQYALELLVAATAANTKRIHSAAAEQPPSWLLAEATEAVHVVFDRLNAASEAVFATFVEQLQGGQMTAGTTAAAATTEQGAGTGGKEEKKEEQKRQVLEGVMGGELSAVSTTAELEEPVYSMDYRSLCLLYSGYVESQLALYFTQHFRLR